MRQRLVCDVNSHYGSDALFLVGIVSFWVLVLVVHFPEYDAGYFKQLAAEQLVAKVVKGSPKREW